MWERFRSVIFRHKPRILMLVDRPGWAYDTSARQIIKELSGLFSFDLKYVSKSPELDPTRYDLVYVFFWGEIYYRKFGFEAQRIMKGVSSHRWEDDPLYGPCTPTEFVSRYLYDCAAILCTSRRLLEKVGGGLTRAYHTPNGFSERAFRTTRVRSGPLTVGWAGNIDDSVKGYRDILEPACAGRFQLRTAPGSFPHKRMSGFYNQVDVLAVCSRHEGEPLTLIEAMAAGCFPVCTDVGIVPEVIQHKVNGYIVAERTPDAFAEAFAWCTDNLEEIRHAGRSNSSLMLHNRCWKSCAPIFAQVFAEVYKDLSMPRFRNDDVSWDTSLDEFTAFCGIFQRCGLTQLHGITLRGCTNTVYTWGDTPVEYEGHDTVAALDNTTIRALSEGKCFEERVDLIDYLNSLPDEIALHGLYHTDYSQMSLDEQREELREGLRRLKELFPEKKIRHFIAPFNRTSKSTYTACQELGLSVLAAEGGHLEAELPRLVLRPGSWYRYHHHRFYAVSTFHYYDLSLPLLDAALRNGMKSLRGTRFPSFGTEE